MSDDLSRTGTVPVGTPPASPTPPLTATVTASSPRHALTSGGEVLVAVALGGMLALLAWALPVTAGSDAPNRLWVVAAGAGVALLGLTALGRRRSALLRSLRAIAPVAVATAAAVLDPALAPAALVCCLAVAAVQPLDLPLPAARVLGGAAAAGCWLPAVTSLLDDGGLSSAADPAREGWALALAVGGLCCLVLAAVAATAGQALLVTAGLADDRAGHLRRTGAELTRATTRDLHTDLPNRAEFLRRAARALARADAVGGSVAVLLVELDRLERVSDGLGPQAADAALAHAARRLRAARPAEDVVARIAPATFAVLVEGVGPEGCDGTARRTAALLEEPLDAGGRPVTLLCTIGVAIAAPGMDTPEQVLRAAEEARDAARRNGLRRWATFDVALRAHSVSQAGLELDLRDALRRGEIELAFQPVWPLPGISHPDGSPGSTADGITVEALARWTRPDGTSVPPSRFVALAEEMGLGTTLGFQVLDRALEAMAGWRARGLAVARISVNASLSQLEDPEFAGIVAARLSAHGLTPACLAVDVRVADLADPERVRGTLAMLHSLGVEVCIDDFGVAGAGLPVLRQVAATTVKLDRVLSRELGGDDRVVKAVVGVCRDLGLRVVAEGVETGAQLRGAHEVGVHAAAGFLLARPVSGADLPVVLSLPPTATGVVPETSAATSDDASVEAAPGSSGLPTAEVAAPAPAPRTAPHPTATAPAVPHTAVPAPTGK